MFTAVIRLGTNALLVRFHTNDMLDVLCDYATYLKVEQVINKDIPEAKSPFVLAMALVKNTQKYITSINRSKYLKLSDKTYLAEKLVLLIELSAAIQLEAAASGEDATNAENLIQEVIKLIDSKPTETLVTTYTTPVVPLVQPLKPAWMYQLAEQSFIL